MLMRPHLICWSHILSHRGLHALLFVPPPLRARKRWGREAGGLNNVTGFRVVNDVARGVGADLFQQLNSKVLSA